MNGYLPFTRIAPSTIIRDVRKLTIAPEALPGQYSLEVGWFSQNTKQALQAQNAKRNSQGNQASIAEVELVKSVTP